MQREYEKWIMRIETYNKVIFTIVGTCAVCYILHSLFISIRRFARPNPIDHRILSETKAKEVFKDKKKKQIISLSKPILIDSLRHYCIIPVTQILMKSAEGIGYGGGGGGGGFYQKINKEHTYQIFCKGYGPLNNLILYDQQNKTQTPIFNDRISINHWEVYEIDSVCYLFCFCTNKDTDNDGILSYQDLVELYVYSTETKTLNGLTFHNYSILSVSIEKISKKLILELGFDRNGNGKYESWLEPQTLKTCPLNLKNCIDFVDKDLLDTMQMIFDTWKN